MHPTSNPLPEIARTAVIAALNERLADGIDLYTQTKVAHWNVRGPLFASVHELFDGIATSIAEHNDEIAERAVTLGGRARGALRAVAGFTRIPDWPEEAQRDVEVARLLVQRIDAYLDGLRSARAIADDARDVDTSDLLTGTIRDFEKHAWMLRAIVDG